MCLIETQCEIRIGKYLSVLLLTRRCFIAIHQWNWRLGRSKVTRRDCSWMGHISFGLYWWYEL